MLEGWRVYPLQLDDLSPISYSSHRPQPSLTSEDTVAPEQGTPGQLSSPAAEDVGPIFYRWVSRKLPNKSYVLCQALCSQEQLQGYICDTAHDPRSTTGAAALSPFKAALLKGVCEKR